MSALNSSQANQIFNEKECDHAQRLYFTNDFLAYIHTYIHTYIGTKQTFLKLHKKLIFSLLKIIASNGIDCSQRIEGLKVEMS